MSGPGLRLGLDGGGSATRWAIADADGAIVARGELPPISGLLGTEPARTQLARVAGSLRATRPDLAGVAAVVAGITGLSADTPEARTAVAILGDSLGVSAERIAVHDDLTIAYHGVFRPGEGHVVYAGTGSVGMHVRVDGSPVQVGGRGMLIDDAGSAFWIGRQALDLIYRRIDDDPNATGRLAQEIYADIGGSTWPEVRSHVYADGRTRVALLARAVARAAEAGDADALALLRAAGTELARLAWALVRREGVRPVALIGRAATLHPVLLEALRAAAQGLELAPASPDAAAAAARLALRMG